MDIFLLRSQVSAGNPRVARLGSWPAWIRPDSLVERLPTLTQPGSGGFDAGVACALDLIPRGAQEVSAALHAAYTPDVLERARLESADLDPDSSTAWWLAACSVCTEGEVDLPGFFSQLEQFELLRTGRGARLLAARTQLGSMLTSFELKTVGSAEVPFALRDGGMQGAYLAGHPLAVHCAPAYGIFFVGTYLPTLGLDGFDWADPDAPGHQGTSGPVFGSSQFVKARDAAELARVLARACPTVGL